MDRVSDMVKGVYEQCAGCYKYYKQYINGLGARKPQDKGQ